MAIKGTFNYQGIAIPNAYVRGENFVFIGKFQCRAQMGVYVSEMQAETIPYNPLVTIMCDFTYNPAGSSVNSQAYAAAMRMPEFQGFDIA